jgi:metal-responsive CopG/Arc/MetJ family transcriptional regulator
MREKVVRTIFLVTPSLLVRLDNYRRVQPGEIPSRSEVVRDILEKALSEFEKEQAEKGSKP